MCYAAHVLARALLPHRFTTSWLLSTLAICIIPPLFLLVWAFGRLSRRYIKEQLAASAAAATVAEECFGNLRTVRSFAKEGAMRGSYETAQGRTLHYGLRAAALEGCFFPLTNSLATGGQLPRLLLPAKLQAGLHATQQCLHHPTLLPCTAHPLYAAPSGDGAP